MFSQSEYQYRGAVGGGSLNVKQPHAPLLQLPSVRNRIPPETSRVQLVQAGLEEYWEGEGFRTWKKGLGTPPPPRAEILLISLQLGLQLAAWQAGWGVGVAPPGVEVETLLGISLVCPEDTEGGISFPPQ